MCRCVVGLGSSLGIRREMLELAVAAIRVNPRVTLGRCSRIYETPPLGESSRMAYLNAAISLDWEGSPNELLVLLKSVEERLGRQRSRRWADRVLDADLLWVEGYFSNGPNLVLPHPGLKERNFAIWPLLEVEPGALDESGVTYWQRLQKMRAPTAVGVLAG